MGFSCILTGYIDRATSMVGTWKADDFWSILMILYSLHIGKKSWGILKDYSLIKCFNETFEIILNIWSIRLYTNVGICCAVLYKNIKLSI
jgi:hypothetical protein